MHPIAHISGIFIYILSSIMYTKHCTSSRDFQWREWKHSLIMINGSLCVRWHTKKILSCLFHHSEMVSFVACTVLLCVFNSNSDVYLCVINYHQSKQIGFGSHPPVGSILLLSQYRTTDAYTRWFLPSSYIAFYYCASVPQHPPTKTSTSKNIPKKIQHSFSIDSCFLHICLILLAY